MRVQTVPAALPKSHPMHPLGGSRWHRLRDQAAVKEWFLASISTLVEAAAWPWPVSWESDSAMGVQWTMPTLETRGGKRGRRRAIVVAAEVTEEGHGVALRERVPPRCLGPPVWAGDGGLLGRTGLAEHCARGCGRDARAVVTPRCTKLQKRAAGRSIRLPRHWWFKFKYRRVFARMILPLQPGYQLADLVPRLAHVAVRLSVAHRLLSHQALACSRNAPLNTSLTTNHSF